MKNVDKRQSGVLMHISSLPGLYGIGDFGQAAFLFADFLYNGGFSSWQVLPLSPVSEFLGNSPYSSSSAFALNYLFVSPEKLAEVGLVGTDYCESLRVSSASQACYAGAKAAKSALLRTAWENFSGGPNRFEILHREFNEFCVKERAWLEDYALFYVLKEHFKGVAWRDWPSEYKFRVPAAMSSFLEDARISARIEYIQFVQFILHKQWNELKYYCNSKGIELIGDIPIYVAYDSVDVWAGQEFFDLNDECLPNKVAGVPPDYFSETGQYWGNPVYRWDVIRRTNFRWWVNRLKHSLSLFDRVRIDHFRGFCRYWAIPAEEKTAVNGAWEIAPGRELFETLRNELANGEDGALPLFAEDLGVITEDVCELMNLFDLPGMKVLLFAFGDDSGNPYLPHNYDKNCIVYTGTHDNDTVNGWWANTSSERERRAFEAYSGVKVKENRADSYMVRLALASVAREAIIPIQDILGLDGGARMNMPSVARGFWEWRLTGRQMLELAAMAEKLKEINRTYGR